MGLAHRVAGGEKRRDENENWNKNFYERELQICQKYQIYVNHGKA